MIKIYEPTDPEVVSGQFDVYGFTPSERRLYEQRKREGTAMGRMKHQPAPRLKNQSLPGMEDRAIRPIEDAVADWRDIRDRMRALKATEDECKAGLIALMHRHEKAHYKRKGIEITISSREKIRIVCETPDKDDEKPRTDRRRQPPPPDPTPEEEPPIEQREPPPPTPRELH